MLHVFSVLEYAMCFCTYYLPLASPGWGKTKIYYNFHLTEKLRGGRKDVNGRGLEANKRQLGLELMFPWISTLGSTYKPIWVFTKLILRCSMVRGNTVEPLGPYCLCFSFVREQRAWWDSTRVMLSSTGYWSCQQALKQRHSAPRPYVCLRVYVGDICAHQEQRATNSALPGKCVCRWWIPSLFRCGPRPEVEGRKVKAGFLLTCRWCHLALEAASGQPLSMCFTSQLCQQMAKRQPATTEDSWGHFKKKTREGQEVLSFGRSHEQSLSCLL